MEYWLHLGRARVAAKSDVTYTWFQQYADQRSWNTDNTGTLSLPLNRLTPFADGIYLYGRVRPGYEIDTRSFRTESGYGGGLDMRVSAKSTIRVEGAQAASGLQGRRVLRRQEPEPGAEPRHDQRRASRCARRSRR